MSPWQLAQVTAWLGRVARSRVLHAVVAQQPQLRAAVGGRAVVGHLQLAAPGHERGPEAALRLGRLRRNMEEFDGDHPVERRHGDDHPRLLAPHQRALGGVQGAPGPAGRGGSLAGAARAEEQVAV